MRRSSAITTLASRSGRRITRKSPRHRTDAYDPTTEAGRARLHRLLERQHYRLAWWRCAGDEINWRRFFDINGLAGLRIEDDAVFEATHATLLRLYREGLIDGVRVDHVDGLADPPGYCRRLRARLDELAPHGRRRAAGPAWLVVEKILGAGEHLPRRLAVDGTSGYDFMDAVSALLHDACRRRHTAAISGDRSAVVRRISPRRMWRRGMRCWIARSPRNSMRRWQSCTGSRVCESETRDITTAAIRRALVALLSHFPVYRSYGGGRSDPTRVREAPWPARCATAGPPIVRRSHCWSAGSASEATTGSAASASSNSARRSPPRQSRTPPSIAMACCYRATRSAPIARFSVSVAEFHAAYLRASQAFPDAMLATATHDHKRGEDVRARLAVLSECPEEWDARCGAGSS